MLQLKLVKIFEEENKNTEEDNTSIPHVENVLLDIEKSWFDMGSVLVCAYR